MFSQRIFWKVAGVGVLIAGIVHLAGATPAVAEAGPEDVEPASGHEEAQRPTLTVPSEPSPPRGTSPRAPSGNAPGLDSLLQLPSGYVGATGPSVAGTSESQWRSRFERGKKDVAEARARLAHTKKELDGAALDSGSSQWSVAPPNSSGTPNAAGAAPVSFKLRQELKENRAELEKAVRALRDLEIEANLAEVPVAWRGEGATSELTPSEMGQLIE